MALPNHLPFASRVYHIEMDDISTASSAFVAIAGRGKIEKIWTALHTAITTADAAITFEINGVAVTGGSITITQSGSAAGDVDSCEPSAANDVIDGDVLEMISDGSSDTTARLTATVVVREFAP